MTLKVGIISANWGAFAHLPAWRAVPGVEVVGICTSRQETAEAAAKKFGIPRAFWNAEAMAADPEIDIVDCGTRPSIRFPMVLAALRHGKHVYNAIPFAPGIEQARELRDAWRASGKVGVVDAFSQWIPAHALAKEMLNEGFLGQPFGGTCLFNISLFNRPNPYFPYNWFAQKGQGVSALRNLGSHALHMLVFMFGPIEEVVARDTQLLDHWVFPDGTATQAQTNDFACLIVRFKSGLHLQLQVSWNATLGSGWTLDVFGSKGRFVARSPSFPTARDTTLEAGTLDAGRLERVTIPDRLLRRPELVVGIDAEPQPVYPMALAMRQMVEAITTGSAAAPDFEQSWEVERVLEAAKRSTESRRWVRVDEIQ